MAELLVYGVDTVRLHWRESVVNAVEDIYDEMHQDDGNEERPMFEYEHIGEFLDANLPEGISFRESPCRPWAFIGIAPSLPFDKNEQLRKIRTEEDATEFVVRAVKPFVKESMEELEEECGRLYDVDL